MRADATVLAFDVGARRTGVAVGSRIGGAARPLAVLDMREGEPDWQQVERLRREWLPGGFVVGDPLTLEGEGQPAQRRAHAFARALAARFGLPVMLVDERSSSIEAAQRFAHERAEGQRRRRDAELLDAMAAAVILERWLAAPEGAIMLADVAADTDVRTSGA
ncbi:Holliday junction resolvase RuvX [Luteimonas sp. e5]